MTTPIFDDSPHLTPQRMKEIRDDCCNAWNQERQFFGIYLADSRLSTIERQFLKAIGNRLYGR